MQTHIRAGRGGGVRARDYGREIACAHGCKCAGERKREGKQRKRERRRMKKAWGSKRPWTLLTSAERQKDMDGGWTEQVEPRRTRGTWRLGDREIGREEGSAPPPPGFTECVLSDSQCTGMRVCLNARTLCTTRTPCALPRHSCTMCARCA
eukprot:6204449-Pleurochrysis_carterae.AAC.1